jgi:hypothetical protein
MKINLPRTLPDLKQFLGCYFHDYWPEEYNNDWNQAIAAFLKENSLETVNLSAQQLDWLISWIEEENLDQESMDDLFLTILHCNFHPPAIGMSEVQWLKYVHCQLLVHLNQTTFVNQVANPPNQKGIKSKASQNAPSPQKPIRTNLINQSMARILATFMLRLDSSPEF